MPLLLGSWKILQRCTNKERYIISRFNL